MARGPAVLLVDEDGNVVDILADGSVFRLHVATKSALDIACGMHADATPFCGFGERSDIPPLTTTDIWPGSNTEVPTPASAGEGMTILSTSIQDGAGGKGIRTLIVDYLNVAGTPKTETVTPNGTTGVDLSNPIRFVQKMYALTVGSNGFADGDIKLFKKGQPARVYTIIKGGGNMSMNPRRMVPVGKKLIVTSWHATESGGPSLAFRLQATAEDGVLRPDVFLFKDTMHLSNQGLELTVLFTLPAFAIIKVSGWSDTENTAASCSWEGILVDE